MLNFNANRKSREVGRLISRIIDQTTSRQHVSDHESRSEDRYIRTLPAMLGPWCSESEDCGDLTIGITKDLSEHGAAIIVAQTWTSCDVACGFWSEGPLVLRATLRQKNHLGGNIWQLGLNWVEVAASGKMAYFEMFQRRLAALNPKPSDLSTG